MKSSIAEREHLVITYHHIINEMVSRDIESATTRETETRVRNGRARMLAEWLENG